MTPHHILTLTTLLACLWAGATSSGESEGFALEPSDQNVAASRLEGEWVVEPALCHRLWESVVRTRERFEFRPDPKVAEQVPARVVAMFDGQRAFQAGVMTRNEVEHPYLLLSVHGNPYVIWFREVDGDPFGDLEGFNLMVVRAERREDDLLFLGGDFNNQPFLAYQRSEHQGALEALAEDPRETLMGHWETPDHDGQLSVAILNDGTVVPYHLGRPPTASDAGSWTLLNATTAQVVLDGQTHTVTIESPERLLWTTTDADGIVTEIELGPRHSH